MSELNRLSVSPTTHPPLLGQPMHFAARKPADEWRVVVREMQREKGALSCCARSPYLAGLLSVSIYTASR